MLSHDAKLSEELDKTKRDLEILRKRNEDLKFSVNFLESQLNIARKMHVKSKLVKTS